MNKSRKFGAITVIVFFLTVFCGVRQVFAQVEDDENGNKRIFSIGLLAGGNFCQVDGDNFAGYYKTGLNAGGIAYAKIRKNTALSFELLYSEKGARGNINRFSGTDSFYYISNYNVSLKYVQIPVMINFFDQHRSHLGVGVSYARLLNYTENVTTDPVYPFHLDKYQFRKGDLSIVASAQMHIWKGLFAGLRFDYSLIPARKNVPPRISRSAQYNNVWTVRLMYLFI